MTYALIPYGAATRRAGDVLCVKVSDTGLSSGTYLQEAVLMERYSFIVPGIMTVDGHMRSITDENASRWYTRCDTLIVAQSWPQRPVQICLYMLLYFDWPQTLPYTSPSEHIATQSLPGSSVCVASRCAEGTTVRAHAQRPGTETIENQGS